MIYCQSRASKNIKNQTIKQNMEVKINGIKVQKNNIARLRNISKVKKDYMTRRE